MLEKLLIASCSLLSATLSQTGQGLSWSVAALGHGEGEGEI